MAMESERRVRGQTGLRGVSSGFLYEEFLPELRGNPGMKQFREMADNDPVIGGLLWVAQMMVRGVEWRVEPADKSSAAEQAAEFVDQVLFQDMATPFSTLVEDAMSMLSYGFAPMEIVWKVRAGLKPSLGLNEVGKYRPEAPAPSSIFDDRRVGIDRIMPIGQETVWRWYFDRSGNWYALEQQTEEDGQAVIPKEKMLLFRTSARLNNPEGRSILRNAFVSYMRKKTLEIAEGRIAMRSAGIVVLKVPAAYMDPSAPDDVKSMFNSYKTIAETMAQDRQGSVILPSDLHEGTSAPLAALEYLTADSRRPADQSAIIERLDRRIAGSAAADFMLLGQLQHGSFALADSKTDTFAIALGGYLKVIKDEINRTLLPQLWRLNGFKDDVMPQLAHGDLDNRDLEAVGAFVNALVSAGAPLFPDKKLQDHLLALGGLPESSETDPPDMETVASAVAATAGKPDPAVQAEEDAKAKEEAKALKPVAGKPPKAEEKP